jgi:hypothetical protein
MAVFGRAEGLTRTSVGGPLRVVPTGHVLHDQIVGAVEVHVRPGPLDHNGRSSKHGLTAGTCGISLTEFDASEWGAAQEPSSEGERYIVQPGDHLSAVAARVGFQNDDTIWLHPENATLRDSRNPYVLNPGDELFIPRKQTGTVERPTDAEHPFTLVRSPLKLRLRVFDWWGHPLVETRAISLSDDAEVPNTDADGLMEAFIDRSTTQARLLLGLEPSAAQIGGLDPVETTPGMLGRLVNLGYIDEGGGEDPEAALSLAVEEFQDDYGLAPSGEADEQTLAKIVEIYGC